MIIWILIIIPGKINHISPDIRGNLGWRWYKDGKFQTSSPTRTGGIINSRSVSGINGTMLIILMMIKN